MEYSDQNTAALFIHIDDLVQWLQSMKYVVNVTPSPHSLVSPDYSEWVKSRGHKIPDELILAKMQVPSEDTQSSPQEGNDPRGTNDKKRPGRPPIDQSLLNTIRVAAQNFFGSSSNPSKWRATEVITHATFIARAFQGKKNATTPNAKNTKNFAKNFGVSRRMVLGILSEELKAANKKKSAENP